MARARKKVKRHSYDPWSDRNYRVPKARSVAKRYTKGTKKFSRKLGIFR